MPRIYLIVYLIYGIVYILLGLIAFASARTTKKHHFFNNVSYIGVFGIIHGISELVTVIVISDLFIEMSMFLFVFKRILKALSFIYLFKFALCFYVDCTKSLRCKIPEFVFGVWLVVLVYLLQKDLNVNQLSQFFDLSIRYFMAFPMGVFTAYTLFKIKDSYPDIAGLRNNFILLSGLFLIYAIVDGLFVRKAMYFPATMINNEWFMTLFFIPIQYVKIAIGVVACYLISKIDSLNRKYEINQLTKYQEKIACESERARLHNMIHDKTIQKLYSTGLLLETVSDSVDKEQKEVLKLGVNQLNDCMGDLRKIIYDDRTDVSKSLAKLTEEAVEQWQMISPLSLTFQNNLSNEAELSLDSFQKMHCIWMIQEMVVNSIKHSKGTFCKVILDDHHGSVIIKSIDDGVGFDHSGKKSMRKHGLISLNDRINQLNGKFGIESTNGSTVVWISFPLHEVVQND